MSDRRLPPSEVVLDLLERGASTRDVARQYGVSRQAVTYCLRKNKVAAPAARTMVWLNLPWRVAVEHNFDPEIMCLRLLERDRLGLPTRPKDRVWAHNWADRLHTMGKVVDYSREHGFFLVDRQPEDGDNLWRQPQ